MRIILGIGIALWLLLVLPAHASVDQQAAQTEETVSDAPISLPVLTRTLKSGSRGDDVQALQRFLTHTGDYTYPKATGYFGRHTREAVERFQCKNNIVCSGTPETTGFGQVGPKTRMAIAPSPFTSELALANVANRTAHMCLAQNVFFEELPYPEDENVDGVNKIDLGMYAVGIVTLNRVRGDRSYWGRDTVCGVVLKKAVRKRNGHSVTICQFSWVCNRRPMQLGPIGWVKWAAKEFKDGDIRFKWATERGVELAMQRWTRAQEIAHELHAENAVIPPPLEHVIDATYFLNPNASSRRSVRWFDRALTRLGKAGNHVFYREP